MNLSIFSKGAKILGVPSNTCWSLYIICILGSIALILYDLTYDSWISQGDNQTGRFMNYNVYYSDWEGSLFEVTRANLHMEGESYDSLSEDYCQIKDDLNSSDAYYNLANAWCEMFTSLYIAGIAFSIFESFALLFFMLWAISLIFVMMERYQWIICSICNAVAVLLLHILGCMLYARYVPLTYFGSCEDLKDGDSPGDICVEEGAKIATYFGIVLIVIVALFILLAIFAYIRRNRELKRLNKKTADSDFTSRVDLDLDIRQEEAKGAYVGVGKSELPPIISMSDRKAPQIPVHEILTPGSCIPTSSIHNLD